MVVHGAARNASFGGNSFHGLLIQAQLLNHGALTGKSHPMGSTHLPERLLHTTGLWPQGEGVHALRVFASGSKSLGCPHGWSQSPSTNHNLGRSVNANG